MDKVEHEDRLALAVREDGESCGFGAALVRALLRFVDGLFFGLVAALNMKPPLYQRLGDKAAETIVVGSRDPVIRSPRPWWWFVAAAVTYLLLETIVLAAQLISIVRW